MAGFGLRLVRHQGGEGYAGNLSEFPISPSNTSPIFTGDLVALSAGFLVEATGGGDADDFNVLGVFQGCRFVDSDGSIRYRHFWDGLSGRSMIRASVALPVNGVFHVRGEENTTYTQAAVGQTYGAAYNMGSTVYGDSRVTLGAAPSPTGPLLVHGLARYPGNEFSSDQPIFEVSILRQSLTAADLPIAS